MNRPDPQLPVVERRADRHDESTETHPAYGQIGASRVSSSQGEVMYGSDFLHYQYVVVTVHESQLHRTVNHDWPSASKELIRVAMSEAQWGRFVSAFNTSDMAQCTIERVAGEGERPAIAEPPRRSEQYREEIARDLQDAVTRVEALQEWVTNNMKTPARMKEHILSDLHMIRLRIADNAPYAVESFDKHVEKTMERARLEINAHIQATIHRAGLAALTGQQIPFELPEKVDDES